jgi:hypothetical protein
MAEGMDHQASDSEIRQALEEAVSRVWSSRLDLVSQGASERTVVARIAFELEPLAQNWSVRWRADVEYNLWHHQSGILKKALHVHDGTTSRKRSVFPDLILHDPVDQEGSNLLVLEAKRGRPHPEARDFDVAKLQAYVAHLHYRQAVYLEFDGRGSQPQLHWLGRDGQLEDPWAVIDRGTPEPRRDSGVHAGLRSGASGMLF